MINFAKSHLLFATRRSSGTELGSPFLSVVLAATAACFILSGCGQESFQPHAESEAQLNQTQSEDQLIDHQAESGDQLIHRLDSDKYARSSMEVNKSKYLELRWPKTGFSVGVAGWTLVEDQPRIRNVTILADSPIARAGVLMGSDIVAINGKESLSPTDMVPLFSDSSQPVVVRVREPSGVVREVTVKPVKFSHRLEWTRGTLEEAVGSVVKSFEDLHQDMASYVADGRLNAAEHLIESRTFENSGSGSFMLVNAWAQIRRHGLEADSISAPDDFTGQTPWQQIKKKIDLATELDPSSVHDASRLLFLEASLAMLRLAQSGNGELREEQDPLAPFNSRGIWYPNAIIPAFVHAKKLSDRCHEDLFWVLAEAEELALSRNDIMTAVVVRDIRSWEMTNGSLALKEFYVWQLVYDYGMPLINAPDATLPQAEELVRAMVLASNATRDWTVDDGMPGSPSTFADLLAGVFSRWPALGSAYIRHQQRAPIEDEAVGEIQKKFSRRYSLKETALLEWDVLMRVSEDNPNYSTLTRILYPSDADARKRAVIKRLIERGRRDPAFGFQMQLMLGPLLPDECGGSLAARIILDANEYRARDSQSGVDWVILLHEPRELFDVAIYVCAGDEASAIGVMSFIHSAPLLSAFSSRLPQFMSSALENYDISPMARPLAVGVVDSSGRVTLRWSLVHEMLDNMAGR